ncbi:MAG: hypothetical protein ABI972_23550, partial [Acidobacteriota bacterium]
MYQWFFSTSKTVITVVATCAVLVCTPDAEASDYSSADGSVMSITEGASLMVDGALQRSIRFELLATQWRNERGATSSITAMAMVDAYQKIIGMGPDAIPLIISQLRAEGDEPDQWFWALRVLTGA